MALPLIYYPNMYIIRVYSMSATVAVEKPVAVVDVVVLLLPHRAGRRRSRQFGRKAIIVIKYFMLYFVRLFHVHTHTHRISIPFRCPIRSLVFLGLMLAYACTFFLVRSFFPFLIHSIAVDFSSVQCFATFSFGQPTHCGYA